MTCPPGMLDCGGECRDVSNDPEYCGSCEVTKCDDAEFCQDGACVCRPELSACGGACVDLGADPQHCGGCDQPCEGESVCVAGACKSAAECDAEVCGGGCVDTETSPLHCGGCGNACAVDQICAGGECYDYEPAAGCASCGGCDACPKQEPCCELPGYGVSCIEAKGCG